MIFKDRIGISGLTTATSIWVTAALGMAAGAGELGLAAVGVVLVLIVLALFDKLQSFVDRLQQKRSYKFQFPVTRLSQPELDRVLSRFGVNFVLRKVTREAGIVSCWYDVWGHHKGLLELSNFSVTSSDILSVEYSVYGLGPDGTDSVGTT